MFPEYPHINLIFKELFALYCSEPEHTFTRLSRYNLHIHFAYPLSEFLGIPVLDLPEKEAFYRASHNYSCGSGTREKLALFLRIKKEPEKHESLMKALLAILPFERLTDTPNWDLYVKQTILPNHVEPIVLEIPHIKKGLAGLEVEIVMLIRDKADEVVKMKMKAKKKKKKK